MGDWHLSILQYEIAPGEAHPDKLHLVLFIRPRRKTLCFSSRDMKRVPCLEMGGVDYLILSSTLLYNVLHEHKDSVQV